MAWVKHRGSFSWLILGLAFVLRWPFAEPQWFHGDEWAFTVHPLGFWSGDLNPHFFNYPTLQFYLNSVVYYLYFLLFITETLEGFVAYRYFVQDADLIAIARGISTLTAVGTVAATICLGTSLYGRRGGLIAGLFLAVMPLHVRFSHLAIVDMPAALWTTLAVLFAVRVAERGHSTAYLMAGVCTGLAAATKYPGGLVVLPVIVAALLDKWTLKNGDLWIAIGTALACFSLATPFVWLDFGKFWADFSSMAQVHLLGPQGETAASSWSNLLRINLRYGLGIAGLAAFGLSLIWRPRTWRRPELVLLTATVSFLWLLAFSESTFMRYALPLAPLLAVQVTRPLLATRSRAVVLAASVVLLAEPVYSSLHTHALLSGTDTRTRAATWLAAQSPAPRRIFAMPPCGADVPLWDTKHVAKRQSRFAFSFGLERLRRTYQLLSQRDDLPVFYSTVGLEYLKAFSNQSAAAESDSVLVLWYRHPLCDSGADSIAVRQLLGRVNWQAEFAPGETAAAVFDRMDAFFLPIGRWSGVQATGPAIHAGVLPLLTPSRMPGGREYFSVLNLYFTGYLALQEKDWPTVLDAYEAILDTPIYLNEFLSLSRIYKLLVGLGVAHYNLEHVDEAIDRWNRATFVFPEQADAYVNLGKAYRERGEAEQAILHLKRAIERGPRNDQLFFLFHSLGLSFMDLGRFEEAVPVLENAVALRSDADAYLHFGIVCMRTGRKAMAIDAVSRSLELAPDRPAALELLRRLRTRLPRPEHPDP